MKKIAGKNIFLQPFSMEHLSSSDYAEWLRDSAVTVGIYRYQYLLPMPKSEVKQYVEALLRSKNDQFFALCENSGQCIGTVRLAHIDWEAKVGSVGIMIGAKSARGKGYSKEAVQLLCDYAFSELGMKKMFAGTAANNFPMVKCFDALGFKREGQLREKLLIDGEYIDQILFGLLFSEWKAAAK